MTRLCSLLLLIGALYVFAAAAQPSTLAVEFQPDAQGNLDLVIPNEYVVQWKRGLKRSDVDDHLVIVQQTVAGDDFDNQLIRSIDMVGGDYQLSVARLSERAVEQLRSNPDVVHIEQNRIVTTASLPQGWTYVDANRLRFDGDAASVNAVPHPTVGSTSLSARTCTTQTNANWNLARIDDHAIVGTVDSDYTYSEDASNVDIYVVGTGVLDSHVEFGGRVVLGYNAVNGPHVDCNGYETHVAGIAAGATVGVAKDATIISVKVMACTWYGLPITTIDVVADGINYAITNAGTTGRRSVINLSLSASGTNIIDDAVNNAVGAGLVVVSAAANYNGDACAYSPARVAASITVGSTKLLTNATTGNQYDARASDSNYGFCVDLFAPGDSIVSAWIGSNNATYVNSSGTANAAPHVAGVAAILLAKNPTWTPAQVASAIVSSATSGVIALNCSGGVCNATPNKLLYVEC